MTQNKHFIQEDILLAESVSLESQNRHLYKQSQAVQLFISPSTKIFIQQQTAFTKFFQAKEKENRRPTDNFNYSNELRYLNEFSEQPEYINQIKQNFGVSKQSFRIKAPVCIEVQYIRALQIVEAQMLTKSNQPDAQVDKAVFIDFKTKDNECKQLLIMCQSFPKNNNKVEEIYQNIHTRQLIYAAASASLRSQISLFKGLECDRVDLDKQSHFECLSKAAVPLQKFLVNNLCNPQQSQTSTTDSAETKKQTTLQFESNLVEKINAMAKDPLKEHILWRRIGFQSAKPQSDFRASGLFGLLSIVYCANTAPDFLLNGSYVQKLNAFELGAYVDNQKQQYNYPVSISIIQLAHMIITHEQMNVALEPSNLIKIFINDFISDYINLLGSADELSTLIQSSDLIILASQLTQNTKTDDKTTLFTYINLLNQINEQMKRNEPFDAVFQNSLTFNALQFQFLPLGPVQLQKCSISALNPQLCGSFFKLVVYLAIELNRRLSCYSQSMQYQNYAGQYAVLAEDFKRVLGMDDVMGVDDFIDRIRKGW
ncbi:ELMO/CED-12_family protein [Hexamita inflata]|uniref:ELMO/CED-12_family protein n=1 Tax=Hexamita inflata TaxID=28002 RepID=A0ABP1L0Q7_9EUKA